MALYIEMQVENEEKKMELGMELHGCFQSNEVAETWEKEFRELLQINGTAALYSVARGLVMSITDSRIQERILFFRWLMYFDFMEKMKSR